MGRDVGEMIRTNYEQARNRQIILPHLLHRAVQAEPGHHGCTMFEAIRHLYASPLYERLADESTKLWHLGATTLYGEVGQ